MLCAPSCGERVYWRGGAYCICCSQWRWRGEGHGGGAGEYKLIVGIPGSRLRVSVWHSVDGR